MIVFDVTDLNSFEKLSLWIKRVEEHITVPMILVGNKIDSNDIVVKTMQAEGNYFILISPI